MKKNSVFAMMVAAAALLSSCGSGDNGSTAGNNAPAETTAASAETTAASAETTTTAEETAPEESETAAPEESAPDAQGGYDYPESIMSDNAPYGRSVGGTLKAAIPGIYDDHLARGGYADYLKFERNGNAYFMYDEGAGWTKDVPSWMDAETLNYTLDEVPAFMFSTFIEVIDGGPFMVDHLSPFSLVGTEVTLESDEHIEIDGREFIRQSGTAHGKKYGTEGDAYFTVYYGISEKNFTTLDGNEVYDPFMVIALSGDLSDEGRQIVNDSVDYAMTHSDLVS